MGALKAGMKAGDIHGKAGLESEVAAFAAQLGFAGGASGDGFDDRDFRPPSKGDVKLAKRAAKVRISTGYACLCCADQTTIEESRRVLSDDQGASFNTVLADHNMNRLDVEVIIWFFSMCDSILDSWGIVYLFLEDCGS